MTSSLDVIQQALSISNVRSIVVSEIIPVEAGCLRAIRFFWRAPFERRSPPRPRGHTDSD
jgi:hypothetical protein